MEISKHVSHDRFQCIYLHDWTTEVHQRASKSYYCLLLWLSDKTIIKLGRDWLSPDLKLRTGPPLCKESLENGITGPPRGMCRREELQEPTAGECKSFQGAFEKLLIRRAWNKGRLSAFCCKFPSWQNQGMFRLNQHLDEGASCAGHLQELPDLSTALRAEAAGVEIFPMHPSLWEQSVPWTALHFCLKENQMGREIPVYFMQLSAATISSHYHSREHE